MIDLYGYITTMTWSSVRAHVRTCPTTYAAALFDDTWARRS